MLHNIGRRRIAASLLVFVLTVAATCIVGYEFYRATKESIRLRGEVNAVQSAKEFDGYLLMRKNTVILASHVLDELGQVIAHSDASELGKNDRNERDENISPQTRDELSKIGSSARHLLSIVNDILDMSRIESGRMTLKEEKFSFRELLDQIRII